MTGRRIQTLRSLRDEMVAVAKGERKARAGAAKPSFNSVAAVIHLLTPENRRLLALIRDKRPDSIASLATVSGRSQPNLSRTLQKLEAAGLVTMRDDARKKVPTVTVREITVRIDPYSTKDRLEVV